MGVRAMGLVRRLILALVAIMEDVFEAFFEPLPIALAIAVVITLVPFLLRYRAFHARGTLSARAREWATALKEDDVLRGKFILVIFIVLVIERTLIGRGYWSNPLRVLWEGWGLHDSNGNFTGEGPENLILLMPVAVVLLDVLLRRPTRHPLARAIACTAAFSLLIETCQLVFHVGTFQFSDLTYNTLGGALAATAYWHWWKRHHDEGESRG